MNRLDQARGDHYMELWALTAGFRDSLDHSLNLDREIAAEDIVQEIQRAVARWDAATEKHKQASPYGQRTQQS